MKCECGEQLRRKIYRHLEKVGPYKVCNARYKALTCNACGEVILKDQELQRYELQAAACVLRQCRNVPGEVLSYARKSIGMTVLQLSFALGVTKECIQDQEIMKTPISCGMQLAIIAILEGISEGRISKSDILSCTASTRATRKRDTTFEVQKPQLPLRPA